MPKKHKIISALAAGIVVICGGTGAAAYAVSNEVSIDNQGEVTTVRTFDKNVDTILEKEGIQIETAEKVTPALNQNIAENNNKIIIEQLATLNITVDDGYETITINTDASNIEEALAEAGYEITNQKVSPNLDTKIVPGETTHVSIETPRTVTFKGVNGEHVVENVFYKTVGEAADKYLTDYKVKTDTLTPGREALLTKDTTIEIVRNRSNERVETEEIAFKKKTVESDKIYKGEEKITTKGAKGVLTKTIKDTTVNGKVTKSDVIEEKVTKKPVDEVTTVGTKAKPEPKPEPVEEIEEPVVEEKDVAETSNNSSSDNNSSESKEPTKESSNNSSTSKKSSTTSTTKSQSVEQKSSGSGKGLLKNIPQSKIAQFDKLAMCESTGNWSISTGMFEGGVQFLNSTWLAYGGGEFAPHAYQATREEQIYVANKLQNVTGWRSSWPACSVKYGWN